MLLVWLLSLFVFLYSVFLNFECFANGRSRQVVVILQVLLRNSQHCHPQPDSDNITAPFGYDMSEIIGIC